MGDDRGPWRHYDGVGIPCDPASYVDVCEGRHDVYIDIPASQAFDRAITHWRPSIDDANRAALAIDTGGIAEGGR